MNNFLKRTITGAVYVGVILASILIHPLIMVLVTTLIVFMAMKELRSILGNTHFPNYWFFIISVFFLASVLLIFYSSKLNISIILLLLLLLIVQISAIFLKPVHTRDFLINFICMLSYIAIPLFLLNLIHNKAILDEVPYTLGLFILVWTNDTFAYLAGIMFGKHKLYQQISAKKTWEGLYGGILTTLAASYILYLFYPAFGIIKWLIFGLLTAVASVFGDFLESALKRSANLKDSGTSLPGHGGILDRIDSLLLVCPVIYIYLSLLTK